MEEVIAGNAVMGQSLFEDGTQPSAAGFVEEMSEGQEALRAELALVAERLDHIERRQATSLQKLDERQTAASAAADSELVAVRRRTKILWILASAALTLAAAALVLTLLRTA